MQVQMAVVCDFAADYDGKICVQGTFDHLASEAFPLVKDRCCYVFQVRWERADEGVRELSVGFANGSGQKTMEGMTAIAKIAVAPDRSCDTTTHVVSLEKVSFSGPGCFVATLSVDGEPVVRVPIDVMQKPAQPRRAILN